MIQSWTTRIGTEGDSELADVFKSSLQPPDMYSNEVDIGFCEDYDVARLLLQYIFLGYHDL